MARITTPLTATEVRAARPAEKEYTLQDGNGLYLLAKPNGAKIWRFNYVRPGDKKRAQALTRNTTSRNSASLSNCAGVIPSARWRLTGTK